MLKNIGLPVTCDINYFYRNDTLILLRTSADTMLADSQPLDDVKNKPHFVSRGTELGELIATTKEKSGNRRTVSTYPSGQLVSAS